MTSDLQRDASGAPLSESEQEKVRLEHQAARLFMRLYEACFDQPLRHIWHNQPKKPDVSCLMGQGRERVQLDLEIAHLYGSRAEAMLLLGRDWGEATEALLQELEATPLEERLMTALNRVLAAKARKNYHSEKVWLVVRNMNPLWQREDFLRHWEQIYLPADHPFEQIWLVADFQGSSGLIQIYPPRRPQSRG